MTKVTYNIQYLRRVHKKAVAICIIKPNQILISRCLNLLSGVMNNLKDCEDQ